MSQQGAAYMHIRIWAGSLAWAWALRVMVHWSLSRSCQLMQTSIVVLPSKASKMSLMQPKIVIPVVMM
eukprot:2917817-Amphidinium_carterae.1